MKYTKCFSLTLLLLIVSANFQLAQAGVGVEAQAGTLGAGGSLVFGLASHANLRLGVNQYEVSKDFSEGGLDYSAEFKPDNQYLMLDLMPFSNGSFRISVGSIKNDNSITAEAKVIGSADIGGTTINAGGVKANIGFNSSATYVGIGWGNAVSKNKRIGLSVDLGVINQGAPIAALVVDDPSNTVTAADIANEKADLEKELEDFELYPVLMIGLTIRFH